MELKPVIKRVSQIIGFHDANAAEQRTKTRVLTAFVAVALLPSNLCRDARADETQGLSDKQVLIGSCIAMTGSLKERGIETTSGAGYYFNHVNDKGGVNGRKIKFTVCDDGYDPDKAIDCFNDCLKNKVFAGAFFVGSAPVAKYLRMAQASKTPMLGFCTGTPAIYDFHPTEFALRASYMDETDAIVQQLTKQHKKRIALIYQNDAFGAAIRETLIKILSQQKVSLVAEEPYVRDSANIKQACSAVIKSGADAVVLAATSDAIITILKQAKEQNFAPQFATVSTATDFLLQHPVEAEGIVISQVIPLPSPSSQLSTVMLYNKLRKKYSPKSEANSSSLEGFVNAMVVVEGLKRAGPDLTRTKFVQALETIHDYDLGCGPNFKLTYTHTNHSGFGGKSVYCTKLHDGKLVAVERNN